MPHGHGCRAVILPDRQEHRRRPQPISPSRSMAPASWPSARPAPLPPGSVGVAYNQSLSASRRQALLLLVTGFGSLPAGLNPKQRRHRSAARRRPRPPPLSGSGPPMPTRTLPKRTSPSPSPFPPASQGGKPPASLPPNSRSRHQRRSTRIPITMASQPAGIRARTGAENPGFRPESASPSRWAVI